MDDITNNPKKAGQVAVYPKYLGLWNRYSIAGYHTPGDSVEWRVADAQTLDRRSKPTVVAQAATRGEALGKLSVIINEDTLLRAHRTLTRMGQDPAISQALQETGFDDELKYLLDELVNARDVAQQARDHQHLPVNPAEN